MSFSIFGLSTKVLIIQQHLTTFFLQNSSYISLLTNDEQIIVKVLDNDTGSHIREGDTMDRADTVCGSIDFEAGEPIIFEDISTEKRFDHIHSSLVQANVNSYVGVPILLQDGQTFGTLCAVHPSTRHLDSASVKMLKRLANMFSYYVQLEHMAYRDSLTGLYNRQFLYQYFREHIQKPGTLLFLDIDEFKEVNDEYGHDVGDIVLREVAQSLTEYIQKQSGFVVRLGGDEFVIHLNGMDDRSTITEQAQEILSCVGACNIHLKDFKLTASLGIVHYNGEEQKDIRTLLKQADNSLYRAKSLGKNQYQFFQ